ncbi:MAG: AAA family ATPase [Saprospiraceae bacterium]|nr:AAA family ATPase [Saprospiraceae bacterium]
MKEVITLSRIDDLSEDELDDLIENGDFEVYMENEENYRKTRKNILIIEEPEAHLHPKVQVHLMEIFAELTKHNVKVILTSHSNYMFNKLSNMLLKKEIAPEKVGVYHMIMTEKGSVVAPDMQATTQGIEDHNFADVAKELYQERLETYDLLNEDPDAVE